MKTIEVVAAVIQKNKEVFATQRGYGDFKGGWEFPGGKMEAGETPVRALEREILEELETKISVGDLLKTIEFDYPEFHLTMHCFLCTIISGNLVLKEHQAAKWVGKEALRDVAWLPADWDVIDEVELLLEEE